MNYSCSQYELTCNECGKRYGNRPLSACPDCLAPLEIVYDLLNAKRHLHARFHRPRPRQHLALRRASPASRRFPPRSPRRFHAARPRKTSRANASAPQSLHQERRRLLPYALLQGPRRRRRPHQRATFGFDTVGCSSTGNLANSVAAQAARLGLKACILVPADLEPAKILNTQVYGARLVRIDGNYDQVNRLCSQIADEYRWGFVNVNLRPYYAEGSKTVGYEIAEQLGWRLPDNVVVPMAGGSLDSQNPQSLQRARLPRPGREAIPVRFFGAQATGCSPISVAVKKAPTTSIRRGRTPSPARSPSAIRPTALPPRR